MAANANQSIDVESINWEEVEADVKSSKRNAEMVNLIAKCAAEIMKSGKDYEVRKLQNMIQAGLSKGVPEEDQKEINWVTVKYAMEHRPGFVPAKNEQGEVIKNTFRFQADAKPIKTSGKKQRR